MSGPVAGLAEIPKDVRATSDNITKAEIDRKVVAGLECARLLLSLART